jgi:type VI secretion system secreted protein VgrG
MGQYTQTGRLIAIKVDGQGDGDLLLQSFTCTEAVSRPYSVQAEVLSELPTVDFTTIIGRKATIMLKTNDESKPRYFNGYVSRFAQSGSDRRFHHYHIEIVPWIWFLTRHADCRIYHNKTIPEIVQAVFDKFTAKAKRPIHPNLQGSYSKQEYVVQYRETSLNFISRLLEHAGIYYYFDHSENDHTLVLADASPSATDSPLQASASHIVRKTELMDEDHIAVIRALREFRTGTYTSTDYNFKTPSANLVATENTVVSIGGNDPLEIFDYPGIHGTKSEGRSISQIRMQEHEAAHHVFNGSGRVRGMIPGFAFTMKDHYRGDMNTAYFLTEVRHMATVGGSYLNDEGVEDGAAYSNQFACTPKSVPYRPPRLTPKPYVQGMQTAVVIGKADHPDDGTASDDGASGDGEEIWVDKYGRIIVRFPWDRVGSCSCPVRVAQQWAGMGWGGMVIPRVGQEVLVSFLDGDPDRPIVVGCVYNATQTVPYTLPDNQTRSTFKTRSSKGGSGDNYNELRFEDKKDNEQVFIRGEKDYDTRIKNDSREWIGNNQSIMVQKDRMEKVTGNESIQIGGNRAEKVSGDESIKIAGKRMEEVTGDVSLEIKGKQTEKISADLNQHVAGNWSQKTDETVSIQAGMNMYEKSGQNYAHEAGMAIHIKAGMTMVLEAGMQLSLKVGSSFIDIGPAGIAISGTPTVMINSGGSAGSGSGSSPTDPSAPDSPKDPVDPDEADDGSKGTKMNK